MTKPGDHTSLDRTPAPLDRGDILLPAALVFVTILLYLPSLSSGFVSLDDYMYVVDNEAVRNPSWESVGRFFGEVLSPTTVEGYYQPLAMTSLMIDAWLAGGDGLNPFYYHLTNVILHGVCGGLAYCLFRMLFGRRAVATIGALLFLAHPAQVESVAWISQRKSVVAMCFALACLMAYVRYARSGRWSMLALCAVLMALGNLAKPIVMPLPVVLVLLDFWPLRRNVWRAIPEKLVFAPIVAASAYVAWASQATVAMLGAPRIDSLDMGMKWLGLLSYNLMLYLGNLVWPFHLSPYRSIPSDLSWTNPAVGGAVAGAALLAIVWLTSIRWSRAFFVGFAGFVVLLSPGLGGVHFAATCVGDRFLYLPFVMLLLPVAAWLASVLYKAPSVGVVGEAARGLMRDFGPSPQARAVWAGSVAILVACAALSLNQQKVWANSRNMWFHIQATAPDLAKANYNVAIIHLDDRRGDLAIEPARRAAQADPSNAHFLLAFGRACTLTGRISDAGMAINEAIRLNLGKQQGFGYVALAEYHAAAGKTAEARDAIARADSLGWSNPATIALVGEAAFQFAMDCDAAIEFYRLAVSREQGDAGLRYALAERLRECGRSREALAEYERYISLARSAGQDVSAVERAVAALRRSLNFSGSSESPSGG